MAECVLVSNVVSLVDNNQIEAGWWVKVGRPFSASAFLREPSHTEAIHRIGSTGRCFSGVAPARHHQIHFVNAIPQGSAIKMGKPLFEAFHLVLPLFLGNQRARADNEHGTYLTPRLKLAQDEASFNGLTLHQRRRQ